MSVSLVHTPLYATAKIGLMRSLRAAADMWLAPRVQPVVDDEPRAEGLGEGSMDLMPLAIACCQAPGSAAILVKAVNQLIDAADWHELALVIRHIEWWHASIHLEGAEKPWWELEALAASTEGCTEVCDIAAREVPGGADTPRPAIKMETLAAAEVRESEADTSGEGSTAMGEQRMSEESSEAVVVGHNDETGSRESPPRSTKMGERTAEEHSEAGEAGHDDGPGSRESPPQNTPNAALIFTARLQDVKHRVLAYEHATLRDVIELAFDNFLHVWGESLGREHRISSVGRVRHCWRRPTA